MRALSVGKEKFAERGVKKSLITIDIFFYV